MKFFLDQMTHIYNWGNNKQQIFFHEENYYFFLKKINKYIYPYCYILAYCLLPNQFDILIYANNATLQTDHKNRNILSDGFKNLLSSYAKAINVQENRTGSLFTQNTHSINFNGKVTKAKACFRAIHMKPFESGLVKDFRDWKFSSVKEYSDMNEVALCKKELAKEIFKL